MDRTARLYRIENLLKERRVVSRDTFLSELEVSLATFKRDMAYLRDRMHAPVEYSAEAGGYRLVEAGFGPRHELPGLWFNAEEIHALLTMQQLLRDLQPGLLTPHIGPFLERLNALLEKSDVPEREVRKRIRIFRVQGRHVAPKLFEPVSNALLRRR
jgi:predicted DNA-binding transcriptional regulator YafY